MAWTLYTPHMHGHTLKGSTKLSYYTDLPKKKPPVRMEVMRQHQNPNEEVSDG